jgi:hypothetical protein
MYKMYKMRFRLPEFPAKPLARSLLDFNERTGLLTHKDYDLGKWKND